MTDDNQLLERFATGGDEDAFRELIERHLDLVYSAALRRVNGDASLAQDVAQTVFTDLARKARSLPRDVVLTGWLYEAARFAAANAIRGERRRQHREQEALTMHDPAPDSTPEWEQLCPVLDDAMGDLCAADRNAILLRYFKNQDFQTVGVALGVSDTAARKRVSRAVEHLREFFGKRGVTVGASGLVVVIGANAVQAAPATLAATLTTASLASAAAGTGTTLALLKFMATTKLKLTLAASFAVLLIPVTVWQVNEYRLRNVVAAAPQVPQSTAGVSADDLWMKMFQVMYHVPKPAKDSRLEQLKSLIDQGADVNMAIGFDRMANEGETRADLRGTDWPLDIAVQQARMDMVKLLLANGAKIHGKELAKAAFAGNQDESLAMVTALLQAGADANSHYNGFTALFWASQKGNKNSVKLMLAQPGLRLDETDPDGNTALMAAAEHRDTEIAEMLLQAGANVSITNKHGQTAATFAQKRLERQQAELRKQEAIISKLRSSPK